MSPHYHVEKSSRPREWLVRRVDQIAHIGCTNSRKEALLIAHMLAGWRGTVTVSTGKPVKA